MLHRQANMFCTKDKKYENRGNNKNTSKSTSALKYYNCSKSEHFSCDCQKSLTQLTLDAQAKKSNPLANTAEVTDVKSALVVTIACTSAYIEQVPEVEMTEILASQQANVLTDTNKNNPFTNWVCYNNISDKNNVLINKFISNTIDIIDSGATIHATLYYFCLTNVQNVSLVTVTLANKSTVTLTKARDIVIEIKKGNTGYMCNPVINKIMLKNVYYHLDLNFSLISQVLLCNNSFAFMFKQLECIIYYR